MPAPPRRWGSFDGYARGKPDVSLCPLDIKKRLATTYSPACCSTIGAEGLNFRVRNGNGWDPFANITRRFKNVLNQRWRRLRGVVRSCRPSRPRGRLPGCLLCMLACGEPRTCHGACSVGEKRVERPHMVKPHEKLVPVSSTCYHA